MISMQTLNNSNAYTAVQHKQKQLAQDEMDWRKKRNKRLRWFSGFFLLFFLWAGSAWLDQKAAIEEKRIELEAIQQKVNTANEEQVELIYQVKRLNDYDYIAEIARRDYFLSRPGEVIFKIPEN